MDQETTEGKTRTPSLPPVSPEPPRHTGGRGLTGAVILITIGILLLLSNLGIIVNINWWGLWRFWPVLLILLGLDILLARRSFLGSVALAVVGLAIVGGIIFWAGTQDTGYRLSGKSVTREVEQELGNVNALEIQLDLGATSGQIAVLPDAGNRYAIKGKYTTDERLDLEVAYTVSGRTGKLVISQADDFGRWFGGPGFIGELELGLTDAVPVDLVVNTGASSLTLDLTGIQLNSVNIDGGASSVHLILPREGDILVEIDAGAGSATIEIPRSLEGHINFDGALVNLVTPARFDKLGEGVWETEGYASARNRVLINIDAAVGNISIIDK